MEKGHCADGFTAEFVNNFWSYLGYYIVRSINYSYGTLEMSHVKTMDIITCICKQHEPRHFLRKWCLTTLLKYTYNLASGFIANRIKTG